MYTNCLNVQTDVTSQVRKSHHAGLSPEMWDVDAKCRIHGASDYDSQTTADDELIIPARRVSQAVAAGLALNSGSCSAITEVDLRTAGSEVEIDQKSENNIALLSDDWYIGELPSP